MQSAFPSFGEIFVTNDEVQGAMENVKLFKGKLISNICGGCKKLFIIEDGHGNEGVISTLHEVDENDHTFNDESDVLQAFDNKGQIKKISTGRKHTVFITSDGSIYSYGYGEFGALGHGGLIESKIPKSINRLSQRPVEQVACGEFHTIVLTQNHDMYAWGRGFEGQLGIRQDIDTTSVPMYITYFQKKQVNFIACGSYHSLAIDNQGRLYSWGEGRFGQLGKGKTLKQSTPILVNFTKQQAELEELDKIKEQEYRKQRRQLKMKLNSLKYGEEIKVQIQQNTSPQQLQKTIPKSEYFEATQQSQFKINPLTNTNIEPYPKIINVSAGYAHTACITESGLIYTCGFNQRGQLGLGDKKSKYYPQMVTQDLLGNEVPKFKKVSCGYYTTYAIDYQGLIWSWGGGNLGHKGDRLVDLPRKVVDNIENRHFTDMMSISNQAVFFAQMRTISMRPNYGPSCGGTIISLIGTGFCDTGRQSVRFSFGKKCVQEVSCNYDEMTDSFTCQTPNFEEVGDEENIQWPQNCIVEITLDGIVYIQCESLYLIYSSTIHIMSVFPKCASIAGGTNLTININIDEQTASVMKHLNIGFQPRNKKDKNENKQDPPNIEYPTLQQDGNLNVKDKTHKQHQLNPLDISTNDPELEKENWICVEGFYEKGQITCTVPDVSNHKSEVLNYSVDVSINGQQFTGNPIVFRFYDIKITSLTPDTVETEGGATLKLEGEGFFDTSNKKIIFKTQFGERLIEIQWDKKTRGYSFVAPPLTWLLGGQAPTQQLQDEVKQNGVEVLLTLSGVEWIYAGKIFYKDPEPVVVEPVITEEERIKMEQEAKKIAAKAGIKKK